MSSSSNISYEEIRRSIGLMSYKKVSDEIWEKKYQNSEFSIMVNFASETIDYPSQIKLGDKTTSNFVNSENFVVLECVDRLLRQGYRPENIELEKKWPLGHSGKGKLDILVKKKSHD